MYQEQATIKLIGRITLEFPNIDQNKLRNIIEDVLYNYEMQPMTKALTTLSDLYERIVDYLITKKLVGMSDGTIYNYKLQLIRFSTYITKNVNDIEAFDIRKYIAILTKEKQLKQTSLSSVISVLKSFFSWMYIQGYTTKNIMEKVENIKCEKRLRKPIDAEEIEILKDSCDNLRERAIFEFLYSTGARVTECVNVNVGDIKWDKRTLNVIGKGDKERLIYFTPSAKIHLKKYLESRNNVTNESPLFISSKYPFGRLGVRAIEGVIHKIQNRAGIESSVFPHRIRTSTGTHLLAKGVSLSSIQRIFGHESVSTTMRYAQTTDNTAQQEYNKYFAQ